MGNIPVNLDRQNAPIASQSGPGTNFNMGAIEVQDSANQNIARAGASIGTSIQNISSLLETKKQQRLQIAQQADLAKYEQRREELENERRKQIGNIKDAQRIKKINEEYLKSVDRLVNGEEKDTDGIPIFRSAEAREAAKNDWRRRSGNEKIVHTEHLRILNNEANNKRFNTLNQTLIQNTDNYFDELANTKKIKANLQIMLDEGLISKEEYSDRVKTDIQTLRKSANFNQLAKMDNMLETSVIFEEQLEFYKEELDSRNDITESEKKMYLDYADKLLKQKQNNELAEIRLTQDARQRKHIKNEENILIDMNEDGSLNIDIKTIQDLLKKDDISVDFGTSLIQSIAKANNKAKIDAIEVKQKEKLIEDFEKVWDKVNTYEPSEDPTRKKLANLYTDIYPYDNELSTALIGTLRSKLETSTGLTPEQKARVKANKPILKETERYLKGVLGIGLRMEKGKLKEVKPSVDWVIPVDEMSPEETVWYKKDWSPVDYNERLRVFNSVMSDLREKSPDLGVNEMQEAIQNHQVIKDMNEKDADERFFWQFRKNIKRESKLMKDKGKIIIRKYKGKEYRMRILENGKAEIIEELK